MYLVVEWTTTSAPRARGCCSKGERKVLSTTTWAPTPWEASAMAAMSTTRSSGLEGVSTHTSAGFCVSASASAASSP